MTFAEGEMSKIKSMDFDKQMKLLKALPPMHLVLFDEDEKLREYTNIMEVLQVIHGFICAGVLNSPTT